MPSTTPPEAPLTRYRRKRDFRVTPEPVAQVSEPASQAGVQLSFVIQKHWASRLHYDFRLELDGVLVSWAVPKGPCFDPAEKRMAVHVEDHPLDYASFEGTIPPKQYGAGTVIVWDRGRWEPVGDPRAGMAEGKLVFRLHGEKLAGLWELVRIAKPGDRQDPWMLFKKRDAWARPLSQYDVISALPDSVVAKPLGPVEEREPREARPRTEPTPARTEDLSAAVKAPLPATLSPQLAVLASAPPAGDGWLCETKFDGYRVLARLEGKEVRLFTRAGNDWTERMPALAASLRALKLGPAWLDGEIVVLDAQGLPDFNALQNAFDRAAQADITYFVFDLPFHGGMDLRRVPLASRRAVLERLLADHDDPRVRLSQAFEAPPAQMLEAACRMRLEGIVAKRADSPYASARTDSWLKLKCSQRQEFVVLGFTDRAGATGEVGALMLGVYDGTELRYAGNVGTGWDARTGQELHARLTKLLTDKPPVDPASAKPGRWSRRAAGTERWVRPELVVEASFSGWTPEGSVRHAVYKGLRTDKRARDVARETATPAAGSTGPLKITHPQRVVDPSTGLRKLDVVRYYEGIAQWMLPHLSDRPVSLVRAPDGIAGTLFFQKHPESRMPGLKELDAKLWPGHSSLLCVDSAEALVAAAQMNVLEFHTWNSTASRIDQPDRVIFDLDPGEGVSWPHIQEAALLTHTLLEALGLKCWLKTSGGKGLHVVVPITPRLAYEPVKDFSEDFVAHLAATVPQRFVTRAGAANRVGRIFVDYLRNGHSQTTAAAFSARARPGLGVSMPVAWGDLAALRSASQWTIATAREYLSFRTHDPWADYWTCRQSLAAPIKALARATRRPA